MYLGALVDEREKEEARLLAHRLGISIASLLRVLVMEADESKAIYEHADHGRRYLVVSSRAHGGIKQRLVHLSEEWKCTQSAVLRGLIFRKAYQEGETNGNISQ